MRSHMVSTAVTLCAAALLTAAMTTASAAPPSTPATHAVKRPPVIVDCLWHPDVRPAHFILACGDGNSRLFSLHWTKWDATAAKGTGVNAVNDCKPYCAAGRFHSYPVTVRLDHPRPWKKHPHLRHYTRMNLVYTDGRPAGFSRAVTYPLWD